MGKSTYQEGSGCLRTMTCGCGKVFQSSDLRACDASRRLHVRVCAIAQLAVLLALPETRVVTDKSLFEMAGGKKSVVKHH